MRRSIVPISGDHAALPDLILHKIQKNRDAMEFEDIESIGDLERVSEESVWQNFERLASFIFEKNDFRVRVNTVKTRNKNRRQYDVIAWRGSHAFLVECKKWAGSRYRLSALKKAVLQHRERTTFYEDVTNEKATPIIVTLIEETIQVYEGVPLVPVTRLNAFIHELDNHADGKSGYFFEDTIPPEEDMPEDPDDMTDNR